MFGLKLADKFMDRIATAIEKQSEAVVTYMTAAVAANKAAESQAIKAEFHTVLSIQIREIEFDIRTIELKEWERREKEWLENQDSSKE